MNIKVDCALLDQFSAELEQYSKRLSAFQDELKRVQRILSQYSSLAVGGMLQSINTGISEQISHVRGLQRAAEDAAKEYRSCETGLLGEKEELVSWSTLVDLVGNAGVAGSIGSAIAKPAIDSGSIAKSALSLVGSGAKIAGKMADRKTVNLFGTNTVDAIGFRENLVFELDKYKFNDSYNSLNTSTGAKVAANVGAAVKWAGLAFSGYSNLKSNVDEYYGDLSNPRLWMETVSETVIGEGTKILVGAGVAALAGASAPAWAVGIVGTGTILGLDYISQAVTGQKFTEAVSDSILDLATGAGEIIGNVTEPIFDQISVGWSKLTNWVRR